MSIVTEGLIAYWHHQMGVEGTTWKNIAPDTQDNPAYDMTLMGATKVSDGIFYDGTDDKSQTSSLDTILETTYEVLLKVHSGEMVSHIIDWSYQILYINYPTMGEGISLGSQIIPLEKERLYRVTQTQKLTPGTRGYESEFSLYIDGAFIGSHSARNYPLAVSKPIDIAGGGSLPIGMTVVSAKVYNRRLTSEEITQNALVGSDVGIDEEPPPGGEEPQTFEKSFIDSVNSEDSIVVAFTGNKSLNDSVSLKDTTDVIRTMSNSLKDSVTLGEELERLSSLTNFLSDIATAKDTTDVVRTLTTSLSDIAALEDATSISRALTSSLNDTINFVEELERLSTLTKLLEDSTQVKDTVQNQRALVRFLSDSIAVKDNLTKISRNIRALHDVVNILDATTRRTAITKTDLVELDISNLGRDIERSLSDDIPTGEEQYTEQGNSTRLVDSILSTDVVDKIVSQSMDFLDSVGLSGTMIPDSKGDFQLVDGVEVTDSLAKQVLRYFSDKVKAEDPLIQKIVARTFIDTLTAIDSINHLRVKIINLLDNISVDDRTTVAQAKKYLDTTEISDNKSQEVTRSIIDSLDSTDTIRLAMQKLISLTDSVTFWDNTRISIGEIIPTESRIVLKLDIDTQIESNILVSSLPRQQDLQLTSELDIGMEIEESTTVQIDIDSVVNLNLFYKER